MKIGRAVRMTGRDARRHPVAVGAGVPAGSISARSGHRIFVVRCGVFAMNVGINCYHCPSLHGRRTPGRYHRGKKMAQIITADIGATNSRFAYFTADEQGKLELVESVWLDTRGAQSFYHLLDQLEAARFGLAPPQADHMVVAIAGPVIGDSYSAPPFISWDLNLNEAARNLGLKRSRLINDFVAQAFACRSPVAADAQQALEGRVDPSGALAVIGAGSNLGKAGLIELAPGVYRALPSEGGHSAFPFIGEEEHEYQRFLSAETGEPYITANTVVSGKGLAYLHRFMTGETIEPCEVTARFTPDSTVLDWAARFYGRVCRSFALEIVATAGVYITGGVAAKARELVTHGSFEREFRSSLTMADLLADIPVFLNTREESGLWGGAMVALQDPGIASICSLR
jgi:glucokinase